ncbi:MAG: flagellin lysine-N-methylase [Oscillospiraceae bacterium]
MDITFIEPDFYKDFACIAEKCRYSCCDHPWRIVVDKKTYKMYKSLRNPRELAERLQSSDLYRNPKSENDDDYGIFRMISHKDKVGKTPCAFLNEKGLCDIQLALGGDKLCHTCREYPREYHLYGDNIVEKTLFPDCEAVLELLYKHTEPIRFINYPEVLSNNIMNKMDIKNKLGQEHRYYENYLDLKAVGLAILQDREYCFEDRMVHLAVFCHKLDELTNKNADADIDAFCEEFIALLVNRSFEKLTEQTPNYKIQMLFASNAISLFGVGTTFTEDGKIEIYNTNITKEDDKKSCEEYYKGYIENYKVYMADKQSFLENIMVLTFHNTLMPLTMETASESFYAFALNYIMLRCLISGYMGERKELSYNELIDMCAFLERGTMHDYKYWEKSMEFLKINKMDNLAYIIMLLKS